MKYTRGLLFLFILVAVSCHKLKPIEPGCDCQGLPDLVLKDALAVDYGGLIKVLDPDHLKEQWTLVSANYCNPEFIKIKITINDTIYVSGNVRRPCDYNESNHNSKLELTAIKRK